MDDHFVICQREHSAILWTFIKLPFVIKIFVLSIFEWQFYTGFTVVVEVQCSPFMALCLGTNWGTIKSELCYKWTILQMSYLRNEFNFWYVHGIINTLQETQSSHDSMNRPKFESIAYFIINISDPV